MKLNKDVLTNYRRNQESVQNVTEEIIDQMKGRILSYRKEIVDNKGKFSNEKLKEFVERLLAIWEEKLRSETNLIPDTQESYADSYIAERKDMYRNYLYLLIRSSITDDTVDGKGKKRTNFAFLLSNAKELWKGWCINEKSPTGDGNGTVGRYNCVDYGFVSYYGFEYFGIHTGSLPETEMCEGMTNDGNVKRLHFRIGVPDFAWFAKLGAAKESRQENCGEFCDIKVQEDCAKLYDAEMDEEFAGIMEKREREEYIREAFVHPKEYEDACYAFMEQFMKARTEVLKDFYGDLEEIVDTYLLVSGAMPLMDVDKCQIVCSQICDGALMTAKKYARGVELERNLP